MTVTWFFETIEFQKHNFVLQTMDSAGHEALCSRAASTCVSNIQKEDSACSVAGHRRSTATWYLNLP